MNTIRIAGQAITCTNYTTPRLFDFRPHMIQAAAEHFLAAGVSEVEIPQGVLDPEGRGKETGLDEAAMRESIARLPKETRVIGSYLGSPGLGTDNAAFLAVQKRAIGNLIQFFPEMQYVMLHPAGAQLTDAGTIRGIVDTWAELADYAAGLRPGFQCCLHNHYDSNCETAEQVLCYLDAIRAVSSPALKWAPDTGHSHGMGDRYLEVLDANADLIGNWFHLKTRVPAFDKLHGGDKYRAERDIWGNPAEKGTGLYSGFVNCADPEIETPLAQVFDIIARKAKPTGGVVTGAIEIDNPRQHPRLEVLCSVLYLREVHGLAPAMALSYEEIVRRVFTVPVLDVN
ncbi:MAG: sugar phosphate isomerase/epimerase family protein [Armatimonadota bacterium]